MSQEEKGMKCDCKMKYLSVNLDIKVLHPSLTLLCERFLNANMSLPHITDISVKPQAVFLYILRKSIMFMKKVVMLKKYSKESPQEAPLRLFKFTIKIIKI